MAAKRFVSGSKAKAGSAKAKRPRKKVRVEATSALLQLPLSAPDLEKSLGSLDKPALVRLLASAVAGLIAPAPIGSALSSLLGVARAYLRPEAVEPAAAPVAEAMASSDLLGTRLSAVEAHDPNELQPLPVEVETSMDPRLQLAIANYRTGKRTAASSSTTDDELPVVARVKSFDEWKALPGVFAGCQLGRTGDDSWIVTGRIPVQRIETVRAQPTVISLKASQPLHPSLAATIEAMGVSPKALPKGTASDGGSGVVVGVVDFGCDFMHENFRQSDRKTRLLALWHQAGVAKPDSPFGYGRVHTRMDIDNALASANPYAVLGYGPPVDPSGTHGTHVLDIAAGNGLGSGQPGVAPKADLIFVEISTSDIAWQGPAAVGQTFGDSVHLLEAVRFVFDSAGDRPCVCNLSLGTNGGPHDGTSLVEQGLDAIVNEKPNRAIVIAASNSQADGIHTIGQVPGASTHDIRWRQQGRGGGEIEIWYPKPSRLEVTVVGPDGATFGPVLPGANASFGATGKIAIFIGSRVDDPNNGDNAIGIWVADGLAGTDWSVRLRSPDGKPVDYHAWIERNDGAQASFVASAATHCLGSISTGHDSIVVGSYDAHMPAYPISYFSSAGPTRDGRNKPEVSAPGQNVVAARSRTGTGVTRKSGTSMAAPAVTGLIALIFSEARRKHLDLSISALRAKLIGQALKDPPKVPAASWDPQYGNGRTNGASILP